MGRDVDVELTLPRRCGHQMHRANTPAETPSQYVKRVITTPLLDHLLVEMRSRFSMQQVVTLQELSLVPSIWVTLSLPDNNIDKLVDLYKKDLPSPGSLSSELHSWQHKWQRHQGLHGAENLPTTPAMALQAASVMMFPNIKTLLTILCVLPITTCTSECSHRDSNLHNYNPQHSKPTKRCACNKQYGPHQCYLFLCLSRNFSDILHQIT